MGNQMNDAGKMPMVSVVCPTYNHEPYIRQALDSILVQKTTYTYEILVGEDCSPDNSREILKEYEERYPNIFRMFYRNENLGATKNGYDLYINARGKYITVLELDDYWSDPEKLQKQVDFLENNATIIGCAHDSIIINEAGEIIQETVSDYKKPEITLKDFLEKGFIFQSASLVYRNIYKDGGDYTILYNAHNIVGDLTINSILLKRGNIYLMPDKMSAYRRVLKSGGTNAASLAMDSQAQSLLDTMILLDRLRTYFNGGIDYSPRMKYPMERYITGLLRRESGFNIKDYRYMWEMSSRSIHRDVIGYVFTYPFRKIRNIIRRN